MNQSILTFLFNFIGQIIIFIIFISYFRINKSCYGKCGLLAKILIKFLVNDKVVC